MINELETFWILDEEDLDYIYENLGICMPKAMRLDQKDGLNTISGVCVIMPDGEIDDERPEVYEFEFSTNDLNDLHGVGWLVKQLRPISH